MIQTREGESFFPQAVTRRLVRQNAARQYLDRHFPFEEFVSCAIDLAHSARSDLLQDAVMPEQLAEGYTFGDRLIAHRPSSYSGDADAEITAKGTPVSSRCQ